MWASRITLLILLVSLHSCRDDDPGGIVPLTPEYIAKFPKAYFTQDTVFMVYSDTFRTDTFLMIGEPIDRFLTVDQHTSGGGGYTTMADNIQKHFQGPDGMKNLDILLTTENYDKVGYGVHLDVNVSGNEFLFAVGAVKNTPDDQEYVRGKAKLTYNILTGVRKVEYEEKHGKKYRLIFLP